MDQTRGSICQLCPNGCNLTLDATDSGTSVSGNCCAKGVAFAKKRFPDLPSPFRQFGGAISFDEASAVVALWGMTMTAVLGGASIQGSPERSLRRTVVVCDSGKFILEEIDPCQRTQRQLMAENLIILGETIPVIPWIFGGDGIAVQELDGHFWMIQPYLSHVQLDRNSFWRESWRGDLVGALLVNLMGFTPPAAMPFHSPKRYLQKLVLSIGKRRIGVRKAVTPILAVLDQTILPVVDMLPQSFSHGDAHPLNMLWSDSELIALIDWEFCGMRARIYDAALIVGCVGTESPESLDGPFVKALEYRIRPLLSEEEWRLFPAMVLLLRFNWLSEWLRRDDSEMIEFEISYMNYLMDRVVSGV